MLYLPKESFVGIETSENLQCVLEICAEEPRLGSKGKPPED
jgi:hypothetical protein